MVTRADIADLDRELAIRKSHRSDMVAKMQAECDHPSAEVVEGEYLHDEYGYHHIPPFAVCRLCGYAEEGWHCDYWKLKPSERVSRDTAQKLVLRFRTQRQLIEDDGRYGRKTAREDT